MKMTKKMIGQAVAVFTVALVVACNPEGPGVEYMPDMYRSPSIEPYVDNDEYGNTDSMSVRKPVEGTIPRGYQPMAYDGSEEGLKLAIEHLKNPVELNEKTLAEGKELYGMFCTHCHGAKGDGKGSIKHAVYGAIPAYSDGTQTRRQGYTMNQLTEGHIFHTITYGLNAMGPHASQLSAEERWKIVHYVETLQGKDMTGDAEAEEMEEETVDAEAEMTEANEEA